MKAIIEKVGDKFLILLYSNERLEDCIEVDEIKRRKASKETFTYDEK